MDNQYAHVPTFDYWTHNGKSVPEWAVRISKAACSACGQEIGHVLTIKDGHGWKHDRCPGGTEDDRRI